MTKVDRLCRRPPDSIIGESFSKTDYADTYKVPVYNCQDYSIDYLTALFFTSMPLWINGLMSLRNSLVKLWGLRGANVRHLNEPDRSIHYEIGSKAVLFRVHDRNDVEIVLAENDKHLNFRTSLLVVRGNDKKQGYLYCTTIVHYNNIFGKLYFFPVKPFHQLIIKAMLKIVSTKLNHQNQAVGYL